MSSPNVLTNDCDTHFKRLLKCLSHKEEAKREWAEKAIVDALITDPSKIDILMQIMRRNMRLIRLIGCFAWIMVIWLLYTLFVEVVRGNWRDIFRFITYIPGGYLLLFCPAARIRGFTNIVNIVVNTQDKRMTGALLQAMRYRDVRTTVRNALLRLLPQLQHSDAALLNDSQRAILCQSLSGKNTTEWKLAALKALEQVGDEKAVPFVEKLAGSVEAEEAVRLSAQECLLFLAQRQERKRASRSLLRAADSAGAMPDTLLRPAASTADAAPEQLLRASVSEAQP